MNERLRKLLEKRFGKNLRDAEVLESGAVRIRLNTPQQRLAEKGTVFAAEIQRGEDKALNNRAVGEDDTDNQVTFSFSSEAAVKDYWGDDEILSHHSEDADFSRLREVGAILKNHNPNLITGKPLKVWVDEDVRKAYCTEEFGTTETASTAKQEVLVDKSLRGISVGFIVREWVLLENAETSYRDIQGVDGKTVWVASKWEAMEASHTPIPADPTVGVGRSAAPLGTGEHREEPAEVEPSAEDKRKLEIEKERRMTLKERALKMGLNEDASEEAVLAAEREAFLKEGRAAANAENKKELERRDAISALAKEHTGRIDDIGARAEKAISDDTSAEAFGREILGLYADDSAPTVRSTTGSRSRGTDSQPDMSQLQLGRFILGAIGDGRVDGLERELMQEGEREAADLGIGATGGYLPSCALRELAVRSEMGRTGKSRAQVVGTDASGGYLVGTDNIGLVGALRPRLVMNSLGVKMLTGLRNNVTLPGVSDEGSAEEMTEVEELTAANVTLDQRTLSPNRVGAQIEFSLQLLRQSNPQIDGVLADIIFSRIAQKYNAHYIAFLVALSGVNSVTTSGAALTRTIMRQFMTLVAADNADETPPSWLFNSTVQGKLAEVKEDAGSGMFLYREKENGEGRVLNRFALTSNLMANANIIYGDHTKAWFADWGGLDFVSDRYTKAKSGQIILTANGFIDEAVEHEEHFARATDVDPAA